jgi:hypothetical protein
VHDKADLQGTRVPCSILLELDAKIIAYGNNDDVLSKTCELLHSHTTGLHHCSMVKGIKCKYHNVECHGDLHLAAKNDSLLAILVGGVHL